MTKEKKVDDIEQLKQDVETLKQDVETLKQDVKVLKEEKEKRDERKRKFKDFFKSFTPYQITYLASVFVLVALFAILLPEEMLETDNTFVLVCSIIAVLANPICELLIAKQSKWNFIVSILFIEITESVLYLSLGYYAIALISIIFWIPIDIVSFISWHKHPDQKEDVLTEVKRLNWWQDILMVLAIVAFGVGVGYILTLIPGAEDTYLDAFTSAVGMANGILILLRYNEQWIAWFITLILDAALYIMSGSYIMLITIAAMMVNTIYGFIKWLIYTNKHKKELANKQNQVEKA